MSNGTKYYIMHRCLNCFKVNDKSLTKCTQCNHLFTGEATEEESKEAHNKLTEMQKKAKEDLK